MDRIARAHRLFDLARVQPGEHVKVHGRKEHALTIPLGVKPGARLWYMLEDAWIDFTVALPPMPMPTPIVKKVHLPAWYARGMAVRAEGSKLIVAARP